MKAKFSFVMAAILVVGVGAALYLAPPLLQTAEARLDEQADVYAERARRMLDQYNQAQTDVEDLMDVIRRKYADVDLTADNVITLLADEPRTPLGEQFKTRMQEHFGESGQPATINAAIQAVRLAVDQNSKRLDEAWEQVDQGAKLRDGSVLAIKHSYINSIAAMIRYHQADGLGQRAMLQRYEADIQLNQLRRLLPNVKELEGNAPFYDRDAVDKQVTKIKKAISKQEKLIEDETKRLDELAGRIDAAEKALAESQQLADRARTEMESIQDKGYDVTSPESYDAFATSFAEAAQQYRQANRKSAEIEFGTIDNAVIDETGDLVKGKYLPKTGKDLKFNLGIAPLKVAHDDIGLAIASHETTINGLNEHIAQLEAMKTDLTDKQMANEDLLQVLTDRIKTTSEEARRLLAEAAAEEDEAFNKLEDASQRFRQVSTNANVEFPTKRRVGAEAMARRGDVAYLRGQIYYQRIRQLIQAKDLFTKATKAGVTEFDPADFQKQIDDATTAAMESLREANKIYADKMGPLGSHFSVVGNLAATQLLMGRITTHKKSRKTFHDQGIQLLGSIVKGRKDNPHVKDYVLALERMGVDVAELTKEAPTETETPDEGETPADAEEPAENSAPAETPPAEAPTGDADAAIPDDISYSIIDSSAIPDVKRTLEVRLDKSVSEETLRAIALKLKSQDPQDYPQTFMEYYLPDMTVGVGAWATTHFDPNLEVQILGLTKEEENKLVTEPVPAGREIIGRWLDQRPYVSSRISIFREDDKLYLEQTINDGSSLDKKELIEKKSPLGRQFDRVGGSSSDNYWVLDPGGILQIRDNDELIATLRKIE